MNKQQKHHRLLSRPFKEKVKQILDKAPTTEKIKDGTKWINLVSGMLYVWNEKKGMWVSTGEMPYGSNPMDF